MIISDRYDIDHELEQEQPQRWLDADLESEIPEAPESWGLNDFDDVLSSAGYKVH
ncbi:MAG: hypothetical protein KDK04_17100 [Candidatus Competibacteraceae bacterium]|nr:hypothetical protein [Candidatus Competibacteraceae bacterium]MCB1809736.1 hypothetical protein [Candidatus Competibacteraceae bacterium]MCB1813416.1 hypothetical protein [Candidatus Competibacteraceae bacterium]